MAMIKCSECGKIISDKAASCPHCGNPMNSIGPQEEEKRYSVISDVEKHPITGAVLLIVGLVAIIGGIMFLGIIIGIFGIIGGFLTMSFGFNFIMGYQTGDCPYCGTHVNIPTNTPTFKCPHCKKVSKHYGVLLEEI